MTSKNLSPELVSLIHHVELNESGWWRKAVGQVVKGVLWKIGSPQSFAELHNLLRQEIGISLADDVLQRQLDTLVGQSAVIRMPATNYKLTERAREELSLAHSKATQEQLECKKSFIDSCERYCPGLSSDNVWQEFTKALLSAVNVAGANLFHLLADGNLVNEVDWLSAFLRKFDLRYQEGFRKILGEFFAPSNHVCRSQVLRLLSAHFFAEASQLSPATLTVIEAERTKRTIKVVLDTNFIFSVLGLHDNPGDEAALSLVGIANKSGTHLDLRLYVLPGTIDEGQRVLVNQMRMVEKIRTTSAMSRAALTQPLPSIARKFFDAATKSPGLTAKAFFQPYIDDLRTILLGKGIAVLEAHPAIYNQRQDVVDDVLDEQERERTEVPDNKRKGYDTLLHDAVLWHAVNDRRPSGTDSPFEVEYWAVSIDWRLISFDRRKRKNNASKLPVVLHPSNLVQLVQFWVPRSAQLEETLIDSFRLPLFFQSFDPDDERATVKVLEAISRFENVGDIPEKTLKIVLANQVLRGRLRECDSSNDEIFELVKEELLVQHKEAVEALEKTESTLTQTAASLEFERKSRKSAEEALNETGNRLSELQFQVNAAHQKVSAAEEREAKVLEKLALDRAEADRILAGKDAALVRSHSRYARSIYFITAILAPLFVGAAVGYFGRQYLPVSAKVPAAIALGLIPLALSFLMTPWVVSKYPVLGDWWLCKVATLIGKRAIVAPGMFTLTAIYQGGAWDWVKSATGWTP